MPKPIKKRSQKKTLSEQEVISVYEELKNYYAENKRVIHIAAAAVCIVLLLVAVLIFYGKQVRKSAYALEYEGYKLYHNIVPDQNAPASALLNEALAKFQKAYKKKSTPARLLYIANSQFRLGRNKEALDSLYEFIKKYPDNRELLPLAYYKVATIQISRGEKDAALTTLDTLYALADNPFLKDLALYESAKITGESGREEEAVKKYELLLKNYPDSPYVKAVLMKLAREDAEKGKESAAEKK